jgi:hypothetical protein
MIIQSENKVDSGRNSTVLGRTVTDEAEVTAEEEADEEEEAEESDVDAAVSTTIEGRGLVVSVDSTDKTTSNIPNLRRIVNKGIKKKTTETKRQKTN